MHICMHMSSAFFTSPWRHRPDGARAPDSTGKADPALCQDTTGNLYIWLSAQNYALGGPFGPFAAP